MGMLLFILIIPFIALISVIVIIVSIAYYTSKEKKMYQREVALQKTRPAPTVVMDAERIKIHCRMTLMNEFIRSNFSGVKDWKVVGDDDSMHQAFFTYNIQKSQVKYVTIYFLNGTEKTVKVDFSKLKDIDKNAYSLCQLSSETGEKLSEDLISSSNVTDESKNTEEPVPVTNPAAKKEADSTTEPKQDESCSTEDIVNVFLKRKDVYEILDKEYDAVIEENVPDDTAFEICKNYLMEEHGIILYKAANGWGFSFS